MDKRTWHEKKVVFYSLVLFQTIVIIFMAAYVVLSVNNTENSQNVFLKNGYRHHYDLKRESKGNQRKVTGLKAFNIVVRAKGRFDIDSNDLRNNNDQSETASNGKRINKNDVENYNFNSNNNYSNHSNSDKSHINNNKKYRNTIDRKFRNTKIIITRKNNNNNEKNKYINKNRKEINKINRNDSKRRNMNGKRQNGNDNSHSPNVKHTSSSNRNDSNTINRNDKSTNRNVKGMSNFHSELFPSKQKEPILMFIAIMSAPERIHRRNALRRSWLRQCEQHNTSCYIFTDALDTHGERLPEETYVALEQEQFLHRDLIMTESPGGINFARRYLWIINWANRNYKFDFLLRVDDDYFICMDRLFLELPSRKTISKLYWGHVHCYPPGGIRVDEGFVIVSNDLVQHFIKEEYNSLMCHPFGDQAMAMWINDIENVTYFGDPRVNNEVTADQFILEQYDDICENFLALHGSYPVNIEQYWHRMLTTPWKRHPVTEVTYPCGNQDKTYNKTNFEGMYFADPIPCRDSPVWEIGDVYVGRSGKRGVLNSN